MEGAFEGDSVGFLDGPTVGMLVNDEELGDLDGEVVGIKVSSWPSVPF